MHLQQRRREGTARHRRRASQTGPYPDQTKVRVDPAAPRDIDLLAIGQRAGEWQFSFCRRRLF